MKIQVPKVVQALDLGGYAEALRGQFLHVWVNPPRGMRQRYDEMAAQAQAEEVKRMEADLEGSQTPEVGSAGGFVENLKRLVGLRVKAARRGVETDAQLLDWFAEIWSQGPREAGWLTSEIRELEDGDPALLTWMITETWRLIGEHQARKKKD